MLSLPGQPGPVPGAEGRVGAASRRLPHGSGRGVLPCLGSVWGLKASQCGAVSLCDSWEAGRLPHF